MPRKRTSLITPWNTRDAKIANEATRCKLCQAYGRRYYRKSLYVPDLPLYLSPLEVLNLPTEELTKETVQPALLNVRYDQTYYILICKACYGYLYLKWNSERLSNDRMTLLARYRITRKYNLIDTGQVPEIENRCYIERRKGPIIIGDRRNRRKKNEHVVIEPEIQQAPSASDLRRFETEERRQMETENAT